MLLRSQGRGVSLIFSYIRRLGSFFFFGGGGVKILNFNIFGGYQKRNIFGSMTILWIFFWGGGHFSAF